MEAEYIKTPIYRILGLKGTLGNNLVTFFGNLQVRIDYMIYPKPHNFLTMEKVLEFHFIFILQLLRG